MAPLLIYTVAVYGLSWVLCKSKAGRALHPHLPSLVRKMTECIACTSAWASLLVTFLAVKAGVLTIPGSGPAFVILMGLYSVGATWLIARFWGDAS